MCPGFVKRCPGSFGDDEVTDKMKSTMCVAKSFFFFFFGIP